MSADGNYSFNPWMRPDPRPGDNIDPSVMLSQDEVLAELSIPADVARTIRPPVGNNPFPPRTGYEKRQPELRDVLAVATYTAMRDMPTRQDSGMQGSSTPSLGSM